jgi:hypothetical protein
MPKSWMTSVHFQPFFDVIWQVPSIMLSKMQSMLDFARAS